VLSLCDFTGIWSKPYVDGGYNVVRIDLKNGGDVRLLELPDRPIYGLLAQPPCTHLAGSGARWWEQKGDAALLEALSISDACMRIATAARLRGDPMKFWAMENPVGRLSRFIGEARMTFDPCDFGGYMDPPKDPPNDFAAQYRRRLDRDGKSAAQEWALEFDAYTKRTCLWGEFNPPEPDDVEPVLGSFMHLLPPTKDPEDRRAERSITPMGFARAFYAANQ
jgi:hypothetical protein